MNETKEGRQEKNNCVQVDGNADTQAVPTPCLSSIISAQKQPAVSQSVPSGEPIFLRKKGDIDFDALYERFLEWEKLPDESEKNRWLLDNAKKNQDLINNSFNKIIEKDSLKMQEFISFMQKYFHYILDLRKTGNQIEKPVAEPKERAHQSDQNLKPNAHDKRITPHADKYHTTQRNTQKGIREYLPPPFKSNNQQKTYSTQYLLTVIHANNLEYPLDVDQQITQIILKSRFMKAFSDQHQGQEVFNQFKLSDEKIDYTLSINVVLLIKVSGVKDLVEAKSTYEFKSRLNLTPTEPTIVIAIKRLASIEGVSDQLHRLV